MKRLWPWTLLFLFFSPAIFADVITPLSYYTLPLLVPIMLLEAVILLFLFRKWLGGVKIWKVLLIAVLANLASSAAGALIPLYKNRTENLMWIALAFVLSIFIEWAIYIPFIRRKYRVLMLCSALANLASYVLIIAFAV